MGMEYIPTFFGYRQSLSSLTDEQFGRVVRAALAYAEEGIIPELDPLESLAFAVMRGDIDRAKVKYEAIAERNRVNGMKGGRPKNPENPVGYLGTQENPENPVEPKKPIQDKTKQDKTTQHKDVGIAADAAAPAKKKPKKKFVPPTAEEVREYCGAQGLTIDAERFVDHYKANGWKVGSQSMKDWRATVRNWARRDKERDMDGQNKRSDSRVSGGYFGENNGTFGDGNSSFDTGDFWAAAVAASYADMEGDG